MISDTRTRLEAKANEYERVMNECRAEMVQADAENTAAGHASNFAADSCPTCDDTAELIPLLREAAAQLTEVQSRLSAAEALIAKWRCHANDYRTTSQDQTPGFRRGLKHCADELHAALAAISPKEPR